MRRHHHGQLVTLAVTAGSRQTIVGCAALLLLSCLALIGAYKLADSYIDRLPDHRGFHLVAVQNQVVISPQTKPRRLVLVVVDGLRQDSARQMRSVARLQAAGQCRPTHTGPITISRPVYAVISTGLEQDRTGSRNNDDTSPIAVQSIWDVAHEAGIKVHAASNLEWWQELFPGAFNTYDFDLDERRDFFAIEHLSELSLIHPLRVDTAGHSFGAASSEYRDAVAIVDSELETFLDAIDLKQDIVIVTADHGHSNAGGHGGPADEIANVLTCFAGIGILPSTSNVPTDSRIIAPTISVLLGLPFPKHMRAGDDNLGQIWSIADEEQLGTTYVAERTATIEEFRAANAVAAGTILGQETSSWSAVYAQGKRRHTLSWLGVSLALAILLFVLSRIRKQSFTEFLATLLWVAIGATLSCLLYTWLRGSFDFTSINKREEFLNSSLGAAISMGFAAILIHLVIWRDLRKLLLDQYTQLLVLAVVSLAHPLIYGITLGFPLPGPTAIFLPFILGALVIACAALGTLVCIVVLFRALRNRC